METLYALTDTEPPFGAGTLWTSRREEADYLASLEDPHRSLSACQVYCVDVIIGADVAKHEITAGDFDRLRKGTATLRQLLAFVARGSAAYGWVHLIEHGAPWRGAILYLGDKPLPARRAPGDNG